MNYDTEIKKYISFIEAKMFHLAHVHDAPHAHEPLATHAHVPEAPVLSGPQVDHPASVVGLLVHQPLAVHHIAGHAVGHTVAVHDGVTVVHQLMHLTTEVLPLIDPHPELASVLFLGENKKQY